MTMIIVTDDESQHHGNHLITGISGSDFFLPLSLILFRANTGICPCIFFLFCLLPSPFCLFTFPLFLQSSVSSILSYIALHHAPNLVIFPAAANISFMSRYASNLPSPPQTAADSLKAVTLSGRTYFPAIRTGTGCHEWAL